MAKATLESRICDPVKLMKRQADTFRVLSSESTSTTGKTLKPIFPELKEMADSFEKYSVKDMEKKQASDDAITGINKYNFPIQIKDFLEAHPSAFGLGMQIMTLYMKKNDAWKAIWKSRKKVGMEQLLKNLHR